MHVLAVGHLYGGAIWGLFSNVYDNTKGRRRQVREDNNKLSSLRALWLLLEDGAPSGEGEEFLMRRPSYFFTKTAITRKRKVEKLIPRCKMDPLSEGYGLLTKFGVLCQNPLIRAQK